MTPLLIRTIQIACQALAIAALSVSAACAGPPAPQVQQAASVRIVRGEWRDEARGGRILPYKLYLPVSAEAAPVILFSHGLGGSREGATFLLEHLAENGFVVVALQHPGSDTSLLGDERDPRRMVDRLAPAVSDPRTAAARFGDVRFAIDRLTAENQAGPHAGRFDMAHLGMSGHSYGALTTLVAVGQRLAGPMAEAFRDPRIDAAIVYSPNAPRNQDPAAALGGITTPILHFTGTEDRSPFDLEQTPAGRQVPFQTITGADQYLIVFEGGDHMIYSGRVQSSGQMSEAQQRQTDAIKRETLTFWQAYLLNDAEALVELCQLPSRIEAIGVGGVKAPRCAAQAAP